MQWLMLILLEISTIRPCRDWTNLKDRYKLASYKAESAFSFPLSMVKGCCLRQPFKAFLHWYKPSMVKGWSPRQPFKVFNNKYTDDFIFLRNAKLIYRVTIPGKTTTLNF